MRISIDGARWLLDGTPPHPGSPAEGLLVNVRMVNCVFEDDRPDPPAVFAWFGPDANTNRFVARIPEYAAHGIRAFTVSLQGGMPGYEGAVNSAFNADGTLRDGYLQRVSRVIRAADANGCAVILSCLYQRQHSHPRSLESKASIHAAVTNTARWVRSEGFPNVVLEIANEFAHAGYANWPNGDWLRSPEGQVELIHAVKAETPELIVSTSGMGSGGMFEPVAQAGDFTIIHFNNTECDAIPSRVEASRAYGKPVVCNEDDKIGPVGAEAARLAIVSGAGWGYMHMAKNQMAPFEFEGHGDDPDVYDALKDLTSAGHDPGDPAVSPLFALITQPKDGDRLSSTDPIVIRASLTGTQSVDGTRLEILANDVLIGASDAPPWRIRWEGPRPGAYDLVAVIRDRDGIERARSRAVDIYVV